MGPQAVLFCLEKLRYYRHHDTIKYNILEGSKNHPECQQSFPPKRRLWQKVASARITIARITKLKTTNKHKREPAVDQFGMSFLGNMDQNYTANGVDF